MMKRYALTILAAAALCTQAVAQNRVKYLSTTSEKLNLEQLVTASEQPVQLSRYLFAGYNTLCLPMSMSGEQLAAAAKDIQVERLAAIQQEGNTLNLYFLDCTADGIEAGMPYLVYSPTEQSMRVKNSEALSIDTELKTVRMNDGQGNQIAFDSSWESIEKAGRYGIPAQQDVYPLQSVLIRTEGDKKFLPTRCGFTWELQAGSATRLEIKHVTSLSAEATGISSLKTKGAKADVYDLKGNLLIKQADKSQLNDLKRGIYVINGEKFAVK
jgi:hypothetical protein